MKTKNEFDLLGNFKLFKVSARKNPVLIGVFYGISNIIGKVDLHSFKIELINEDFIQKGETKNAYFNFLFSSNEKFKLKVKKGQVLEIKEGPHKIGEFLIKKVLNKQISA